MHTCRALVLSYNGLSKIPEYDKSMNIEYENSLTLQALLQCLPKGPTSDIANSLLESVEQCSSGWKKVSFISFISFKFTFGFTEQFFYTGMVWSGGVLCNVALVFFYHTLSRITYNHHTDIYPVFYY